MTAPAAKRRQRLLAISHPAVVNVNQEVYRELWRRGWKVTIVAAEPLAQRVLAAHDDSAGARRPGARRCARRRSRWRAVRSGTSTSPAAARCAHACSPMWHSSRPSRTRSRRRSGAGSSQSRGVPFGVQCAENIDRALPLPVRGLRAQVLRRAAFVAARSDSAARLARAWGASGEVALAPHAVPEWEIAPARSGGRGSARSRSATRGAWSRARGWRPARGCAHPAGAGRAAADRRRRAARAA